MHLIALIMLVLGVALQSEAEPLRPFIGGSFGINNTDDSYYDIRPNENLLGVKLPNHGGQSWQAEIGVTNDTYTGYVGYRSGTATYDEGETVNYYPGFFPTVTPEFLPPDLQGRWAWSVVDESELTSTHFVVGGRAQLKIGLPEIIRPMVGVGVTYGRVERTLDYTFKDVRTEVGDPRFPDIDADGTYHEVTESDDAYGGLIELGFTVRPKLPMQFYAVFQLHAYEAELKGPSGSPTAWQYEVREHSFLRVGLMYHFKTFGEDG